MVINSNSGDTILRERSMMLLGLGVRHPNRLHVLIQPGSENNRTLSLTLHKLSMAPLASMNEAPQATEEPRSCVNVVLDILRLGCAGRIKYRDP
jgi:hypothetical protein